MFGNELALTVDGYVDDAKSNIETLHRLSATLESLQDTIINEGMSRDVAQLLEQTSPGCVTERSRLNAFTRYNSPVGRDVGLEAIRAANGKLNSGWLTAIVAAAIAAISALITYLITQFTGKDATSRRERANDRNWGKVAPSDVGASRPQWRDDLDFRAASDAFAGSINTLLVDTAGGKYTPFLKDAITLTPRPLFATVTSYIDTLLRMINETADMILTNRLDVETDVALSSLEALQRNIAAQLIQLENTKPMGLPGRGPLSDRVMQYRGEMEHASSQRTLVATDDVHAIYAQRVLVDNALKQVMGFKLDPLLREIRDNATAIDRTNNALSASFTSSSGRAGSILRACVEAIHVVIAIQADMAGIVSLLYDNIKIADDAYCNMLRAQLEAMQRAGINFKGSEVEFANDRKFYKEAVEYLK